MKTSWSFRWFLSGLVVVSSSLPGRGQDCCAPSPCVTQRVVYKTVWEQERVTGYRYQDETQLREEQVTMLKPVYETERRTRTVRVGKPVTETSTREERYTTYRPVTETFEETRYYNQTRMVTETENREEKHLVARQVIEEQCRTEQHVVRRPVEETVIQQQNYVVNEPVTTMQTSYVDQGSYVDNVFQTPGATRYRLAWVPGGFQTTPYTAWRHAGFGRVPVTTPGQTVVNRQYVPNIVPVQVPQTSMVQKVVTQCVPVTVQKYVDEVVTQQVPVQVQRTEYVEEVKPVTVQVQKPVTEQIAYKVPVVRTRYEAVEVVKPITCTVQRMTYEDVEQPYEVRTMKMVSEVQTVRKPVVVRKLVPYTYLRSTPRTVAMMVPVDDVPAIRQMYYQSSDCGSCVAGPIVESKRVEVAPSTVIESKRIESAPIESKRVEPSPTPAEKPLEKSVKKNGTKAPDLLKEDEKKEPAAEPPTLNGPGNEAKEGTSADAEGPSA